jgi:hypothetical protein
MMCPEILDLTMKIRRRHGTGLRECVDLKQVLYRADVIATSSHRQPDMRITLEVAQAPSVFLPRVTDILSTNEFCFNFFLFSLFVFLFILIK